MDELRLKTGQLSKYSDDLKIKDKTLSAKSALLFKKEQSIKEREIRVEDRESVLRTNMKL